MIILIDGYNLLRQIFPKSKRLLDQQRNHLVKQLSIYRTKKTNIKEIVLVFDAGPFGHATREIQHGITIVFSGQKSNADNWIHNFVKRNKGKEILLISRDRELVLRCEKHNAKSMDVLEFYSIMNSCILEQNAGSLEESSSTIYKFEESDYFDDIPTQVSEEALDLLMEEASLYETPQKIDLYEEIKKKKGNAHKPSKKERKIINTLKKLK